MIAMVLTKLINEEKELLQDTSNKICEEILQAMQDILQMNDDDETKKYMYKSFTRTEEHDSIESYFAVLQFFLYEQQFPKIVESMKMDVSLRYIGMLLRRELYCTYDIKLLDGVTIFLMQSNQKGKNGYRIEVTFRI